MGVVERAGPGVAHLNQGQRVVGARIGTGTWAEYITVPAEHAVRRPLRNLRAHTEPCHCISRLKRLDAGDECLCLHSRRWPALLIHVCRNAGVRKPHG